MNYTDKIKLVKEKEDEEMRNCENIVESKETIKEKILRFFCQL